MTSQHAPENVQDFLEILACLKSVCGVLSPQFLKCLIDDYKLSGVAGEKDEDR